MIHGSYDASRQTIVVTSGNQDVQSLRYLGARLSLLTPLVSKGKTPGTLDIPFTWQAITQLALTFGPDWKPDSDLSQHITDLVSRLSDNSDLLITQHFPSHCSLRDYQIDGAKMVRNAGRVFFADDPGTGKTVTTIAGIGERIMRGLPTLPLLVVAPASVVTPWINTLREWLPMLSVSRYMGKGRTLSADASIYVTSYETCTRDIDKIAKKGFVGLVLDECHSIKSNSSQRTKAATKLATKVAALVELSGTPVTKDTTDFYPPMRCLAPLAYPDKGRWIGRYCLMVQADYGQLCLGLNPQNETEFRTSLFGQFRRVSKEDVISQLPPKIYSTREVHMPEKWQKAYDSMAKDMLVQQEEGAASVLSVISQVQALRLMACAPSHVDNTMEVGEDGGESMHSSTTLLPSSWKTDALVDILEERPDSQVLVFAESKRLIDVVSTELADKGFLDVGRIVGGQSQAERDGDIEEFQDGCIQVMLATTGAGGVGLTLTAASTVVFLQRPWSLEKSIQAEDRAHRIGSERHESIEVIDVVTANTIESRVREALGEKAIQLSEIVEDPRIMRELFGKEEKE